MEKWLSRSVKAAVTAGVVGVGSVGVAQADTTVVTPETVSEAVSVAGNNGILVGNSISVPIVVPVTDNSVAATLVGVAANAKDVLIAAGILGSAHGCSSGGDDLTVVSPFVRSSSTSVVGDNHIGSGNSISVPIVVPITGNDVAVAGAGAAANVDSLVLALGILGHAEAGDCDDNGDNGGGGGYPDRNGNGNGGGNGGGGNGSFGDLGYSEQAGGSDSTVVDGRVVSRPQSQIGDNSILSGNSISVPVYAPITGNDVAVAGIGAAVNADDVTAALGILGHAAAGDAGSGLLGDVASLAGLPAAETQSASAQLNDASLSAAHGDTTVVAPVVRSTPTSVAGDNSIGSGNSISIPIVAPITDNDVAVAGIGAAVNGEDVTGAVGVLGSAEAEGNGGDETIVAPQVTSSPTSVVGDNSILSGNSLSVPVVAPITGNDVAVAGVGAAVNAEDVTLVGGILGTASALLGG
jgi:hypothetical protein